VLFLKPDEIKIPDNRIRREFNEEHIAELGVSISSKGLLNPITVRSNDGAYELVAGENRLRALDRMVDLGVPFECNGAPVPPGTVPCLLLSELPDDLRLEAELEENTHRRDLTWQETAEARSRLIELRKSQHPEGFSASALAAELTRAGAPVQRDTIHSDLRVARFLDDPDVRKAKTKKEALNIVKQKQTGFFLEALGEVIKVEQEQNLHSHRLIEGDCLEEILKLPSGYFSVILTDPPYGIDVQSAGSQVSHGHHYDDSADVLTDILEELPYQLHRVTIENAHLYWFCDITWFQAISSSLANAGWEVDRYPIIWNKNGRGIAPDTQFRHRRTYECVLFATKGSRPLLKLQPDVITISPTADLQQAEKPVELLQDLLSRSAQPGDRILDPFVGSGSLFTAASKAGVFATGIELDPARANLARSRLE
jgi:site-specific DNA-methyltransferase (adenine-specific)